MKNLTNNKFHLLSTHIKSLKEVIKIAPYLNIIIGKGKWNFDLEDSDKVLRLECEELEKKNTIKFLQVNSLFNFELHYLESEIER